MTVSYGLTYRLVNLTICLQMSLNRDNHNARTQLGASAAAKVAELLATVRAFAAFDFSRRAAAGSGDGVLDELAEAINTLGESVQVTHDQLEFRVEERTRRLTKLAGELEAELHERRSSETALRETNERLVRSVEELERAKREIEQLTEMSNLLQVCSDRNEAFSVLAYVGPNLFLASRDVLKPLSSWGPVAGSEAKINPEACWALRRGRPHHSGPHGLRCSHLPEGDTDEALCVSLMAQGVTTGLLHLSWAARVEEMRFTIAGTEFEWHNQPTGSITISAGVAAYPQHGATRETLVCAADQALYATRQGELGRLSRTGCPEPRRS